MKNLKKILRGNLKLVKGGISVECGNVQAQATKCYISQASCENDPGSDGFCVRACNKWCY